MIELSALQNKHVQFEHPDEWEDVGVSKAVVNTYIWKLATAPPFKKLDFAIGGSLALQTTGVWNWRVPRPSINMELEFASAPL